MQFNPGTSDANKAVSLYYDALDKTRGDTNNFPLPEFTRYVNRWYYFAVIEAWRASGDWDFDDTNQSDFPIATTTLVNSQADYSMPANALKLKRVELKDSGGNWHLLKEIDDRQIPVALDEFYETDGLPLYYRLIRNSIVLYPAPDTTNSVTASNGLKIHFLREIDEFTPTDTTQEPGLPEPFHDILSTGAASDWGMSRGKENAGMLKQAVGEKLQQLRTFMAERHEKFEPRVRPLRINPK